MPSPGKSHSKSGSPERLERLRLPSAVRSIARVGELPSGTDLDHAEDAPAAHEHEVGRVVVVQRRSEIAQRDVMPVRARPGIADDAPEQDVDAELRHGHQPGMRLPRAEIGAEVLGVRREARLRPRSPEHQRVVPATGNGFHQLHDRGAAQTSLGLALRQELAYPPSLRIGLHSRRSELLRVAASRGHVCTKQLDHHGPELRVVQLGDRPRSPPRRVAAEPLDPLQRREALPGTIPAHRALLRTARGAS